MDRVLRNSQ